MKYLWTLPILALLAACGADGEPVRPSVNTGISINSNGKVTPRTNISVRQGPIRIGVGRRW